MSGRNESINVYLVIICELYYKMLKMAKGEGKKDTKKQQKGAKKAPKKVKDDEDDNLDEIVNIDSTKKENKNKLPKKDKQFQLEEKDLQKTIIIPQIKPVEKKLESWVPKTTQDALNFNSKFDIAEHVGEFQSLTNQELNKQIKEIVINEPQKQFIETETIKMATLEKTPQQLKMEQLGENDIIISKKDQLNRFAPTVPITNITFSNQSNELKFKPLEKTQQQLREEEMERRQAEGKVENKQGKWGVAKKQPQKQIIIRDTPIMFMNSKGTQNELAQGNYGKIQISQQQRRMMDDDDKLVIPTKEQKERRKKLRQEKEAQQAKILKNTK